MSNIATTSSQVGASELWAELVDALRRKRIQTPDGQRVGFDRDEIASLSIPVYDMRDIGGAMRHVSPEDVADYMAQSIPMRALIGLSKTPSGRVYSTIVIPDRDGESFMTFVRQDGEWQIVRSRDVDSDHVAISISNLLIDDAEANVEFVDCPKLDRVNRGRARAGLPPLQRARVISLSTPRRITLGRAQERQSHGGTHARPVEHIRTISDRWIHPKNRRPYRRRAKVIVINKGVNRVTEVRP